MIDESLLKSNFLGRDGFVWWIGRVAHKSVWKDVNTVMAQSKTMDQRVKVRIIGYHPFTDELPEEDLPWAMVMGDAVTGAGQGSMGDSISLVGGETCLGFFLDGDEAQQPVIMGLLSRHNGVKNSIGEGELVQSRSNGLDVSSGNNNDKMTKDRNVDGGEIGTPEDKGKVSGTETDGTEQGTTQLNGRSSRAGDAFEKKNTKEHQVPSNCGNDAIGQLTQVLTDFISLTNGLESALGSYVDPVANAIYDMEAELRSVVSISQGIVKGVLNNVRNGIIGKLTKIFSQFLGNANLVNPFEFTTDEPARKAFQAILDTIFCLFEKLIEDLLEFLIHLFRSLIENVVNGPICAAEQFVSGIFAKVFEVLEDLLAPVLSGLEWLTGGIGEIQGFLRSASTLAAQIFSFIGCDGRKCTVPSTWVSSTNAALQRGADDWEKQVESMDVIGGIADDLKRIGEEADRDVNNFFGTDDFVEQEYNGMQLSSILQTTDSLTGGNSSEALDRGLGSIESAISTTSLFGENTVFDACNNVVNNPQSQSDLIRIPMGYTYSKCIPPEIEIIGKGSGATAIPIVDSSRRLIAVQVTNPGSGYDTSSTSIHLIDNTNNGSGGILEPIIVDGKINKIVVVRSGRGYCPNRDTGDNPVGIVTGIYIENPGTGYKPGDTIEIPSYFVDFPGYLIDIVPTPDNGSIVDVILPIIDEEFPTIPKLTINTSTGRGAKVIPILEYKPLETIATDTSGVKRSGLVGITSVIDCI